MSDTNQGTTGRALLGVAVAIFLSLAVSGEVRAANKPDVISAAVDFTVGYGEITIVGESFPSTPHVRLDGTLLDVISASPTQIVASLQAVAGIESLPGDYQLNICDGDDHGPCALFVVTIGAARHAAPPCFDDANRYVDCGNGTVTDTVTGLIWLKNANCFSFQNYNENAPNSAFYVSLQDGLVSSTLKFNTLFVWPVRGGQ